MCVSILVNRVKKCGSWANQPIQSTTNQPHSRTNTHPHSGLGKNVIAVTIPIAATIFLADMISAARLHHPHTEDGDIPMPALSSTSSSSPSSSGGGGKGGRVSPL